MTAVSSSAAAARRTAMWIGAGAALGLLVSFSTASEPLSEVRLDLRAAPGIAAAFADTLREPSEQWTVSAGVGILMPRTLWVRTDGGGDQVIVILQATHEHAAAYGAQAVKTILPRLMPPAPQPLPRVQSQPVGPSSEDATERLLREVEASPPQLPRIRAAALQVRTARAREAERRPPPESSAPPDPPVRVDVAPAAFWYAGLASLRFVFAGASLAASALLLIALARPSPRDRRVPGA